MPPSVSITCSGCSAAVPAGDRFCGTCGNAITGSAILSGEGAAAFDPWVELLQKLRQVTLGEYEIKGELGRGGMAAVFLAHDLHLNRKVAIKVMLPGLLYSERMWERFLAEARTAAKLDHPNIIYIHSVKEKDRFLYFVMKYVDGRAMDDILSRGALPLPIAQALLVEIARALDYAHREGIVHRDIKPANIMIDNKGNSIVMDFGIARVQDSAHFTQTGATIGTPAYMSPEQCHGQDVTPASDQYSLGIVAYEMFTGRQPFVGSPIELQLAHIQDRPRPVRELRPDMPKAVADAVMRMIEKDPAKRFSSLAEAVQSISHCCDVSDPNIRERLVEMVRSGPPRRQSFPPTPLSPPAGTLAAAHARSRNKAGSAAAEAKPNDELAVRSAETATVDSIGDDAHSRPTAAIDSGNRDAITMPAPVRDGHAGTTRETTPMSKRRLYAAVLSVVVVGTVLAVSLGGGGSASDESPALDPTALASAPTVATTVDAILGDSLVVGHGPDGTARGRGGVPRTVSADAIALLTPSLGGPTVAVGDTVRATLNVLDDAGQRVTSPQIVWSTSNPRIVKFAGPGRLVGVSAGRATITVAAAAVSSTLDVTVRPRPTPAARKNTP